jgi:hypothetical protein
MKKSPRLVKKLVLHRETILNLEKEQLQEVQGDGTTGLITVSKPCGC